MELSIDLLKAVYPSFVADLEMDSRLGKSKTTVEAIAKRFKWISERRRIPLETNPPLFPGKGCRKSMRRGGEPKYLSENRAWSIMREIARQAGVDSRGKPFYGFRRREVTTLLEEGLPEIVVQKLKGWKTNRMIMHYHKTPMGEMAEKAAAIPDKKLVQSDA